MWLRTDCNTTQNLLKTPGFYYGLLKLFLICVCVYVHSWLWVHPYATVCVCRSTFGHQFSPSMLWSRVPCLTFILQTNGQSQHISQFWLQSVCLVFLPFKKLHLQLGVFKWLLSIGIAWLVFFHWLIHLFQLSYVYFEVCFDSYRQMSAIQK